MSLLADHKHFYSNARMISKPLKHNESIGIWFCAEGFLASTASYAGDRTTRLLVKLKNRLETIRMVTNWKSVKKIHSRLVLITKTLFMAIFSR